MTSLIKSMRGNMFPEITDWSDPQDHLRNANVKDLDFFHFVWFHPAAYTILKLGIPANFFFWITVLIMKNVKYGVSWYMGILFALWIYCMVWVFRESRKLHIYLEMNLYDTLMKD